MAKKHRRTAIPIEDRERRTEIRKSVVTAEQLGAGKLNPASLNGGSGIIDEDEEKKKKPKLKVVETEPEELEKAKSIEEEEDEEEELEEKGCSGRERRKLSKMAFGGDPADLSNDELLLTHFEIHKAYREALRGVDDRPSSMEMANTHALVVDELFKRGVEHPSPPGFWLDDVSKDLESFAADQPDSNAPPEVGVKKRKMKADGTLAVKKEIDAYEKISEEALPYTLCKKWVGKKIELSLLLGLRKNRSAIAWKIGDTVEAADSPVASLSKAKGEHEKTGKKEEEIAIEKALSIPIKCEKSGVLPFAWLDIEACTTAPEPGEIEPIGGDAENRAVFHIVEKGEVEYGSQAPDLHEYFLRTEKGAYRMIFKADGDAWKAEISEELGPYVLSEEAVEKGWLPREGQSGLTAVVKNQVPEEFRFWEAGKEARQKRYELAKALSDGEISIRFDSYDPAELERARVELQKRKEIPVNFVQMEKKAERRLVTGIVLEPDEIDAHNDTVRSEVIEEAAFEFLTNYNKSTKLGVQHKIFGLNGLELVESWIAKFDQKLNKKKVKKGSWLITVKVVDDVLWQKIKKGKITGFSIGGSALVSQN